MIFIAFFLGTTTAIMAVSSVRDTIIIDGFVIEIERNVVYDTVYVAPRDTTPPTQIVPQKKEKLPPTYSFGLEFNPGVRIGALHSGNGEFRTVGDVIDKHAPVGNAFEVGAWAGICLKPDKHLRTGISFLSSNLSFSNFKEESLDDSLWRFMVPEQGSLNQITRYDYGVLGAELDTLKVPLIRSSIREWIVQIPFLFVADQKHKIKQNYFSLLGGFNLRYRQMESSAPVARLAGLERAEFVPVSRLKQSGFDAAAIAGFRYNVFINKDKSFTAGLNVVAPMDSQVFDNLFLNRHFYVQCSFGIKFL